MFGVTITVYTMRFCKQELEAEIEVVKTEHSSLLKLQAVYRLAEGYYSSRYNQYLDSVRQSQIRKAFAAWSDKTTITQVRRSTMIYPSILMILQ
jgi:hypothetical protein